MLHVAHGPFHPALEDAFVARLRELKKDDPLAPVAVVAPSARLANRLKELAIRALPNGVMAVHFHHLMSFARLAAGAATPVEDDFLLERLIRDLVAREFPKSIYLNHIEGAPQLARSLLGVVLELREGGVDPEIAFQALREGHLGEEDRLKLSEIFALQKAYESELERRGWADRADLVRRAAESPELGAFKEILYYGVVELVQVQIDLLKAVSRRHPTRLFYPLAKRPDYAFAHDFFVQVVVPMADRVQALDATGVSMPQVDVVHASGTRDESWACAKRILEWRADGVPFSEIGVVARRLDAYSAPIAAAFSENEIPFSTSAKRPLDGDPYVAAARSLLTVADGGFSRERVMDLLGSPYFKHSGPADPILWDAFSRVLGIGRGADEWKRRLPSSGAVVRTRGERGDDVKLDLPEEQVLTFRRDVDRLLEKSVPPAQATWSHFSSWALGLLGEFLEPGDAAEAVREAFERLGELDRMAGTPSPADRRDTALRALSELRSPLGAASGVRVLDAMAARGLPFRRLIVLGLNERVFPRFILEDPFIRDSVRTRIATRLGPRIAPKLRGYDEERLLFTLLWESARERLVLSWQRSDDAGRLRVRSTFLDAPGTGVPRPPAEKFASVDRSVLTRKEASILEALTVGAKRLPAALRAFGGDVTAFEQRSKFLALLESSRDAGPLDGIVAGATRSRALSPTALESFASCPFQYFAKRMLGLEPLDEPEGESTTSPLEEGNLYHDFLQKFYADFKGKIPVSLDAARSEFEKALAEAFQGFEKERSIRHPLVWEVEKAMMRRVLEAAVAWDLQHLDGFVPSRFESRVEGEIDVAGRPVRFGGYVDRLDLRSDGAFRVIDYKRSRSKGKYGVKMETGVQKGRYVQPPLYFLLAEKMLLGEGRKVAAQDSKSGYFFLRDTEEEDKDPGLWLEGGLGASAAAFADRLERSLGSIERGEYVVTPGDHCTHCDFRTACRRHHVPTVLRALRFHENR